MSTVPNALDVLQGLIGREIRTLSGHPNRVVEIRGADVIVATTRSPQGKPVPIEWVEKPIAQLFAKGELAIEVETVGYRSAFIGAVLLTLPGAQAMPGTRRIRLTRER